MAQPVPYSQWNHFQLLPQNSSSSSWPAYYELPDWQTTNFNYADSAADLPDSSPSPFNDHESLPGSSRSSRRPSSPLSLSVKEEPDDAAAGCFVMELFGRQAHSTRLSQSLAPPTEVPLRATQASSDMRRMMTVFRLNPFAMHNGEGRGTVPVHHEEAHALDAEPLIFEFQLDIDGLSLDPEDLDDPAVPIGMKDADSQGLRSFSPDFELHEESLSGVNDDPGEEWRGYQHAATSPPLKMPSQRHSRGVSSPTLHRQHYPQHNFSNTGPGSRRQPRLHNSASHPYLQKAAVAADSGYASSSSSSGIHTNAHIHPQNTHAHTHAQQHHQHSSHHYQPNHRIVDAEAHTPWISTPSSSLRYDSNYNSTSAEPSSSSRSSSSSLGRSMSTYADVNLPTEHSLVPVRRWSLPDANPHPHSHPNPYPPHAQLHSHSQLHVAAPLPFIV
ncbi:hypothetical protein D9615_005983 [Tricholomella constricta]|uniref:Uncharacterized protein n=1 Tax=Tricholomella constricta TaxID=117010 RepID=A0A8H5H9F8_9AGAR|nr:hypothetical protein D9615_005983 [Tricholomella constricta]